MPRFKTALLTCAAVAVPAFPALAQEARPAPVAEVEELVITGAPYGVTQRATLLAVDVLDEDDLAAAPPATLGDVVAGLPGVRSTSFSAGASRPVIRGLAGPRVQVLTNGVGLIDASALSPDHQVAADPGDATRIEVLRGPATLAYGGTAIGGVVNVIDGRIPDMLPEGGLDGRVSLQGATVDDSVAASARLTAAVGRLAVNLEAQRREAGDYDIPVPAESRRQLEAEGDEAYVPPTEVREFGAFALQRLDRGRTGLEGGLRVDTRTLETDAAARDFTNVSGSLGVFYRPSPAWFLGLSLSRNGRAPTEAELFADGPHAATRGYEIGDPGLGSETVVSLEGTVHYDNGPWTADLHLFSARYDGFIDLAATGGEQDGFAEFRYVQTDARFHGFEAEASYLFWEEGPRRSLSFGAAADYVRGATDLGPPSRIPPWSLTGRAVLAFDEWGGRLELRQVGEQTRVSDYELPTDGYRTINAFVSWRPDPGSGLLLFAEARNLNDAEMREHASFLKDLAPQPGRSLRVGATYRF